ncbi:hypothetical protein LLEC1_06435 [Akanthomyces lecanii]|uniref:Uncharacterized protein n=1 Tax=Cordyceps confragosa TaxID=2714763 RepID=A0A179I1Q6_CORDF|nr:hypothetical protein LLEC1_06435 [Akanthomyces lecanii]
MQFKSLAYILLGQSALVAAQSATTTSSATATCEPHEDHWHCPAGVPQPSLNPDGSPNPKATQGSSDDNDHDHDHDHDHSHDHDTDSHSATASATASSNSTSTAAATTGPGGCTPHNDHWHCPSGVPKPTTPPPGYTPTSSRPCVESGTACDACKMG